MDRVTSRSVPTPTGGWDTASVIAGDFNGDTHQDLVLASACSETSSLGNHCPDGTLGLLLGNGDGSVQSAITLAFPTNASDDRPIALVADLNGDGIPDLMRIARDASSNSAAMAVYLGTGGGKYGPASMVASGLPSGNTATGAITADFNHDGKIDVAILTPCAPDCTQGGPSEVLILLGNGDGTYQAPVTYAAGPANSLGLTTADVNGDANLDLVVANQCIDQNCQNGAVSILLGNGNGTFQSPVVTSTPSLRNDLSVVAADFNGDGKADVAVGGSNSNTQSSSANDNLVSAFLSNGDGTLTAAGTYSASGTVPQNSSPGAISLAIGDLNGDGKPDIVATSSCAAGDVNLCTQGGGIGVLLGQGGGNFTYGTSFSAFDADFYSANLRDIDGDGKLDLIASTLTGVYVALGKGDGTFNTGTVYASPVVNAPTTIAIADVNGDGAPDIVSPGTLPITRHNYGPVTAILLNRGPAQVQTMPVATLSATSINFGIFQVGGAYPISRVQLTNTGTAPLAISSIQKMGANPGDFSESDNCPRTPSTLQVNTACTVFVNFTPTQLGPLSAAISISDNAPGSPQQITLTGTAVDFSVSASPSSSTVKRGKSTSYNVSVAPLGGNTLTATLSATGCPSSATCTFNPSQFTLNGKTASTSKLTVTTGNKTPRGTFTLKVIGTVFTVSHSTTVTLTVQ